MTRSRPGSGTWLMLALVMLLWAGNSIVGRAVRGDVPPFTLSLVRWTLAMLVVLPFALVHLRRDAPALWRGWPAVLALGLLGVACFNALLYKGLHLTTATNALLIQAAIPALVALFDRLLFGVRVVALQALGVAASTLGVFWIVLAGRPNTLAGLHLGAGDAMVLAAAAAWALYTVLLRKRPDVAPSSFLFVTFVIGVLAMLPLAAGEWMAGERIAWGPAVLAAFAYVGLLPSVVAYFLYNAATARVGAARAGQAITLMPLFGAVLSASLLGEQLDDFHFVGMALILAGIAASALSLRAQKSGGAPAGRAVEDGA